MVKGFGFKRRSQGKKIRLLRWFHQHGGNVANS